MRDIEIENINKFIENTYSNETEESLSDENLLEEYQKCQSTQDVIEDFINDMLEAEIEIDKINYVLKKRIPKLIPPGTKGVVRGNMFNKIVKEKILSFGLANYEIVFEKQHPLVKCTEKPDFYIYNPVSKKLLIGMNQIDLWSGGAQSNRGSKYVIHNPFENSKYDVHLIAVVCNKVEIKSIESKGFQIFKNGIDNHRICYINGLREIVDWYFK